MIIKTKYSFLLAALALLCYACNTPKKLSKQNWSKQYYGFSFESPLKHRLIKQQGSAYDLYLQIDEEEAGPLSYFQVRIRRFAGLEEREPIDTLTVNDLESLDGVFTVRIDPLFSNDVLKIELIKRGLPFRREKVILVAAEPYSDVLLRNEDSGELLFDQHVEVGTPVVSALENNEGGIRWLYTGASPGLAPVPFAENYGEQKLSFKERAEVDDVGLYVGKIGDGSQFPLVVTAPYFPRLTAVEDLVHCLRYVTKKQEYDKLLGSSDMEASVDSFWMSKAGSVERGKKLIKEFYGRVQRANAFFTDFKEGWKTDRGLIYTIYGQPEVVQYMESQEIWRYNAPIPNHPNGLMFTFDRLQNEMGLQMYRLQRSSYFEESWHYMINEWRHGRIANVSY